MQRFLSTWLVSTIALAFAAWLLGDHMSIGEGPDADTGARVLGVLLVGLVFTIVNSFVAPVVKTLSIPFIIVTLGLALLVINALLLLFTEWIADKLDMHFDIDGFWWAVLASIVISIAQSIVGALMPSGSK